MVDASKAFKSNPLFYFLDRVMLTSGAYEVVLLRELPSKASTYVTKFGLTII
jgi:hypothetical protein